MGLAKTLKLHCELRLSRSQAQPQPPNEKNQVANRETVSTNEFLVLGSFMCQIYFSMMPMSLNDILLTLVNSLMSSSEEITPVRLASAVILARASFCCNISSFPDKLQVELVALSNSLPT